MSLPVSWRAWRLTCFVAGLCTLVLALAPLPRVLPVARAAAFSPNFPRLATIYSKTDMNTAAVQQYIANNNLYVTDFANWPAMDGSVAPGQTVGQHLKSLNPNLIALIYQHSVLSGGWDGGYNLNGTTYYIQSEYSNRYSACRFSP